MTDGKDLCTPEKPRSNGYECQHCDKPFDPISTRYLCPHCKVKNTCCEG